MTSIVPAGTDKQDERCDESCHEGVPPVEACSRCDTLEWALMCDSCRYYMAQDGA